MSTWHALFYPIKEGSEETVKELFRNSGRPNFEITSPDGKVVGRLLATMAFVGTGVAIRVIHVDGPLPVVAAHMSRQPEVREFERQLEEHLTEGRDMVTPEGARAFFQKAGLENVLNRQAPEAEAA
jgi:SchA/CurD like domain-containing protein